MSRIMRQWAGVIRTEDRDAYRAYIEETGLSEYRSTPGNLDAWMLYRDLDEDRTEVVTLSLWESRAAIEGFAGKDIGKAVFYPDDDRFLVERELTVRHFDVVG